MEDTKRTIENTEEGLGYMNLPSNVRYDSNISVEEGILIGPSNGGDQRYRQSTCPFDAKLLFHLRDCLSPPRKLFLALRARLLLRNVPVPRPMYANVQKTPLSLANSHSYTLLSQNCC